MNKTHFQESDTFLKGLLENVQTYESNLAGGEAKPLGKGSLAVKSLFETKVSFGNPKDRLILLTEETFSQSGSELDTIYRQQMQSQYDFYSMTLTVSLQTAPGAQFKRLACELDFEPKGDNEPIIETIFPIPKWRDVLKFGVGMDVGLNGSLEWSAGINPENIQLLPPDWKANVATKNEFKGFVAMPAYQYTLGNSEITATGEGNSNCYWYIQDRELQKMGTVKFAVVFKVPKGTESITLRGVTWAEPNMNWLTANVEDVFRHLKANFKNLLTSDEDEAGKILARGVEETWTLKLS